MKKIVMVFFILIIFMGFFSKSIINLFLPQVKVTGATGSPVEKSIQVNGQVVANNMIDIRLPGSVIIKEFLVENGDEVEKGTPIFKIDTTYGIKGNSEIIEEYKDSLEIEKIRKNSLEQLGEGAKEQLEILNKQIEQIEAKIKRLEKANTFYQKVDKNGVYKAETDGIVINLNNTNVPLVQDAIILQIANVKGKEDYKYVANFSRDQYDFINQVGEIELQKEYYDDVTKLKINNINTVVEDDMMKLEANFTNDYPRNLFIGEKLNAKIVMKKKIKGYLTVSKAVLNPYGDFINGNDADIYIVEEKDGILGKEYIAKRINVKMEVIGDHEVIVSGLDRPRLRVITNPSYKIKDGSKVFIWE
ncbi:efflux RND transporter periplasmic adaptor subunit [Senegalia massiliensis]|uniref:efflux RND transporter periplasmic adaptor subunit n=1 Tax=Senegalia massiliensis TaxID=1720316 RepID=UPI001030F97E|nr:efflux RND transporter periplasmic adaptor subunit [Senegalia massiliensis]